MGSKSKNKFLATILTVVLGPFRLITDPLCKALFGMDTPTAISYKFGNKTTKCLYCGLNFNSTNMNCSKSPDNKHHER